MGCYAQKCTGTFRCKRWHATPLMVIGVFLGVFAYQIHTAEALKVTTPSNWDDAEDKLEEIEDDVNDAQCGGWDFDQSAAGKFSTVTGVPGRGENPFGQVTLGMGLRNELGGFLDDGFMFPDSSKVWGWTSACSPGNPPYYVDNGGQTPCKNPRKCEVMCARISRWQYPLWKCEVDNIDDEGNPFVTTTFLNSPCKEHKGNNPMNEPARPAGAAACDRVIFLGWIYCCTGQFVTQMQYENCNQGNPGFCVNHADNNRNCLRCEGDGGKVVGGGVPVDFNGETLERGPADRNETGCRVGRGPHQVRINAPDIRDLPNGRKSIRRRQYRSFFRQFVASFARSKVLPWVPKDNNAEAGIPVNCYGRYKEFDAKLRRTTGKDRHCLLDIQGNPDISKEKMRVSQLGKANFDPGFADVPFSESILDRRKTMWWNPLNDNIAGGNKTKYTVSDIFTWKGTFTSLLNMASIRQRASVQMTPGEPRSTGALIRAFDETVSFDLINPIPEIHNRKRTIVEWWQEQQTEAHKIFSPPVMRVLFPPAWSVDLDPLQPLLSLEPLEETVGEWEVNPLLQPMEVQLELREDLLGEVAEFLRRSLLLQIQQEYVPVVVPLGSATEFRSLREKWCHWYKFQNKAKSCDDASGKIGDLLKKLEEYAVRVDDYRKMRAELPQYLAKYLDMHNKINRKIGKWVIENGQVLMNYQVQRQQAFALKGVWDDVQEEYREFHDQTNLPWCKNDRFTTSIYSLLDPWMPLRPDLDGKKESDENPKGFPYIIGELGIDLVYDLTHLSVSSGAIKIPVLRPIQVSYSLKDIQPPLEYEANPNIPELPDLPPVPSMAEGIEEKIPEVETGDSLPGLIEPPNLIPPLEETEQSMQKIKRLIRRMNSAYKKFWNSLTRIQNVREKDCPRPNSGRCIHVEMDLVERFTRIGARPTILLQEDYDSIGTWRQPPSWAGNSNVCPKEDWACMLLSPEYTLPRKGWGVFTPDQDEFIDEMRVEGFEKTLVEPYKEEPPFPYTTKYDEILPSLDVPKEIEIYPFTNPES